MKLKKNKIKLSKRSKSLYSVFIKNYIYAILGAGIGITLFLAIFIVQVIHIFASNSGELTSIGKSLDLTEEVKDDSYNEKIVSLGGWIEKTKDGKIIDVVGTKNDDMDNYTVTSLINNRDSMDEKKYGILKAYEKDGYIYIIKIPSLLDMKNGNQLNLNIRKSIVIALVISLLIIIITLTIITIKSIRKISKPLEKIEESIDEMSKGNLDITIDFNSYKQIDSIKDSFNYMVAKLKEAEIQKEKYENSKRRMIRDISHDIKTPITSIMGYSKLILQNKDFTEEEKNIYLKYIYDKTSRLNYLVDELFIFSKLDSPAYKMNKVNYDICEFMREMIAIHYIDIEEKGFEIDIEIPEYEIYVNIDKKEMDRAISNLISNSLKYNPIKTTITIELEVVDKYAIILFKDNGVGIPFHISSHIFEEFVRGDKARGADGGSGLGLAITKKIINLHSGEISINSKENEGTEFIIKLPIVNL